MMNNVCCVLVLATFVAFAGLLVHGSSLQDQLDAACDNVVSGSIARYYHGPSHGSKEFHCYTRNGVDFLSPLPLCIGDDGSCYPCYGVPIDLSTSSVFKNNELASILSRSGVSFNCPTTVQDQLDNACTKIDSTTPFARFDTGGSADLSLKWRCMSGDALDFQAEGVCISDDGSCLPCSGAVSNYGVDGISNQHAHLTDLIKNITGSDQSCKASIQQKLNGYCQSLNNGKSYARYGSDLSFAETWRCFSQDELDFSQIGRCEVSGLSCGGCLGMPRAFPRSCTEIRLAGESSNGYYDILLPNRQVQEVFCNFNDEGDAGGYTMVPCDTFNAEGCTSTNRYDDVTTCESVGLKPMILRSATHFEIATRVFSSEYFKVGLGVYRDSAAGISASQICSMRSTRNGESGTPGCDGWKAIDGGKFYLREDDFSEPNGDYMGGCYLRTDVDRTISTREFSFINDYDCNYHTNQYICSTNDHNSFLPSQAPPDLWPSAMIPSQTFDETSFLMDIIDHETGGTESTTCAPSIQEKINNLCKMLHPSNPFARFAAGDSDNRLPQWRCFDGNSLSFDSSGVCVDDTGDCVACDGDHIHAGTQYYDEDDKLTQLIKQLTGNDNFQCLVSLQHKLNHFCATNVTGTAFARLYTHAVSQEDVWQCFPSNEVNFGIAGRSCVGDDGYCNQCEGVATTDATFSIDHDDRILNVIDMNTNAGFKCSLQDNLDSFCKLHTGYRFARYGPASQTSTKLAWRCYSSQSVDSTSTGVCVGNDGVCESCLGKVDISKLLSVSTPPNMALENLIQGESGSSFFCSAMWKSNTLWSLQFQFNDPSYPSIGFFELKGFGKVISTWGAGNWSVDDKDVLSLFLPHANLKLQSSEGDGVFVSVGEQYSPIASLDVNNGKIITGGEMDWTVVSNTGVMPEIVAGPKGNLDALYFSGKAALRVSSPSTGIPLRNKWTIDCFFKTPFVQTGTWHTLVRGNHHLVIVSSTFQLGSWVSGFTSTQTDLSLLSDGWHRLTVISDGSTVSYFVDGENSGAHDTLADDFVNYIGTYAGYQPWGHLHKFRVFDDAVDPIALPGIVSGAHVDKYIQEKLFGMSPYTQWDVIVPGEKVKSFLLLPNGVGTSDWGEITWELNNDGTFTVKADTITLDLVLVSKYAFTGYTPNGGQSFYGKLRAKYFETPAETKVDLHDFGGYISVKMWGGGGGGSYGGAGAFVFGSIDTTKIGDFTVEVGEPNYFQGSGYPFMQCEGGGRVAIWTDSEEDELLVAGGAGGGRTETQLRGGDGGALKGGDAQTGCDGYKHYCSIGATGGTQSAGGLAGHTVLENTNYKQYGEDGGRIFGSWGIDSSMCQGCPAGNGYYGGGTGGCYPYHVAPGAGGSSFVSSMDGVDGIMYFGNEGVVANGKDVYRDRHLASVKAGDVGSLSGKVVLIFQEKEVQTARDVLSKSAVISSGKTYLLSESDGTEASLAIFDDNQCEIFIGGTTTFGTCIVNVDGSGVASFGSLMYNFDFSQATATNPFMLVSVNGLISYTASEYPSDASSFGAFFASPGGFNYIVPPGVNEVDVFMFGAGGVGTYGGAGGFASGVLTNVGAGQTIMVEVGGTISHLGGGAASGKRSAIYFTNYLEELMVAGGGGGSGSSLELAGGGGGSLVEGQFGGQDSKSIPCSGDESACTLLPASGGTVSTVGKGGLVHDPTANADLYTTQGTDGERIVGGSGIADSTVQGGAGGGGYNGGGSGGANDKIKQGGGGGSSFVDMSKFKNVLLVGGNYTQRYDQFPVDTKAGLANQFGAVYIRVKCPAGFTDYHPLADTPCNPCGAGTYAPAGSIGTCKSLECAPGTYDHDSDSSTPCKTCGEGLFIDRYGYTSCFNGTKCDPTSGEAAPLTKSSDRVCIECVEGITFSHFDSMTGLRVCSPVSECDGESTESAAPTTSSDRMCNKCEGNTYASDGYCLNVTVCSEGSFSSMAPTTTTDRKCSPCAKGTFSDTLGADQCKPYSICGENQFELVPPSRFSNRICKEVTSCGNGFFMQQNATASSDAVCSKCTTCPNGDVTQPCTATTDTTCDSCKSCASSQYVDTPCTTTEQAVCKSCGACDPMTQFQKEPCRVDAGVVCVDFTECKRAMEFEIVPPSFYNDRVCQPLTGCSDSEYEVVAPTSTTDRVCAALSMCTSGYFISSPATKTSDLVCSACPSGTYDHDNNYATNCKQCDAGTYSQSGSVVCTPCDAGYSDDDSNPATPCRKCDGINWYQPSSKTTTCLAVTTCHSGQEEAVSPTYLTDRVCVSCVEGSSFKPSSGEDTKCERVATCGIGYGEALPPTLTSNRLCSRCLQGTTYSDSDIPDSKCKPVSPCDADEFELQAPTLISDRICRGLTSCQTGVTYQALSPTLTSDRVCLTCSSCPGVTTQECTIDSDAECENCGSCNSNQYVASPCTKTSPVQCNDCRVCDADQFVTQTCVGSSDTICVALSQCNSGQFESKAATTSSDRVCTILSVCGSGFYEYKAPTATTDRTCVPVSNTCPSNAYESQQPTATSDRVCSPLTVCMVGTFESKVPTSTSNRVCTTLTDCVDEFHYESMPPSISNDRVCSSCIQSCGEGLRLNGECTSTSGPSCVPCNEANDCLDGYFLHGFCIHDQTPTCERCKTCGQQEYETVPCTKTSDRTCALLAQCDFSIEYERISPSVSSNRVCNLVSRPCASTEYESLKPTRVNDRVCTPLLTCDVDDEYEAIPPSTYTNRVCKPIHVCTSDEFEAFAPTVTSDRLCQTIGACTETEYILSLPTVSSDVECESMAKLEHVNIVFDVDFDTEVARSGGVQYRDDNTIEFWMDNEPDNLVQAIAARLRTSYSVVDVIFIHLQPGSVVARVSTPDDVSQVLHDSNEGHFWIMLDGIRVTGSGAAQLAAQDAALNVYLEYRYNVTAQELYTLVLNIYAQAGGEVTLFSDYFSSIKEMYPTTTTPAPAASKTGLQNPAALGGLIAAIAVVFLIVAIVIVVVRNKKSRGAAHLGSRPGRDISFSNPVYATGAKQDMYGINNEHNDQDLTYEEPGQIVDSAYDRVDPYDNDSDEEADTAGYLVVEA
eukprot:m.86623 g.86623  ORF g.86623 m.86623 type:complete len:3056 (+) comp8766_c1_seq2:90-9257(+)